MTVSNQCLSINSRPFFSLLLAFSSSFVFLRIFGNSTLMISFIPMEDAMGIGCSVNPHTNVWLLSLIRLSGTVVTARAWDRKFIPLLSYCSCFYIIWIWIHRPYLIWDESLVGTLSRSIPMAISGPIALSTDTAFSLRSCISTEFGLKSNSRLLRQ